MSHDLRLITIIAGFIGSPSIFLALIKLFSSGNLRSGGIWNTISLLYTHSFPVAVQFLAWWALNLEEAMKRSPDSSILLLWGGVGTSLGTFKKKAYWRGTAIFGLMRYRSETQGRIGQSGSILDGCYAKVEDARVRPRQDWGLTGRQNRNQLKWWKLGLL